ncbi:MAG: hypothetical protein ABI193_22910 [Minicystis sp.]
MSEEERARPPKKKRPRREPTLDPEIASPDPEIGSRDPEIASPDVLEAEPPRDPDETLAQSFRAYVAGRPLSIDGARILGLLIPALLLGVNMLRVQSYTVDDSYISFRYARNLARGLGLVYNPGERIEGYTNFLWTLILALAIKLGLDPVLVAKLLGATSAFAALFLTYAIGARLRPYRSAPAVAPWLLASTVVFSGYAVFGLETSFFVALVLGGTLLFLREVGPLFQGAPIAEAPTSRAFPWSGLLFALAGLTRPEAPLFLGLLMLFLGRRFFARQNLLRAAIFIAPLLAHLAFRRAYYGAWVPNTLGAKTGNLQGQLVGGWAYLHNYLVHGGPLIWLALIGVAVGLVQRRRDIVAIATITITFAGYIVLIGGDWMSLFRFMAPFEPFCFLLIDVGVRWALDRRERITLVAFTLFALGASVDRWITLRESQTFLLAKEKRFWEQAGKGTARWLLQNDKPGLIAMGDIGYVGWETDYPILDLLGLVDPVIARLPGGYTQKLGPGFLERFFSQDPRYFLLISSALDCQHPSVIGSTIVYNDPRFRERYEIGGRVPLDAGFAWCVYQRKP